MGDHYVTRSGIGNGLTKVSVTMSGASAALLPADASRQIVLVSSTKANGSAAIDPTGATAALDAGIAVEGGDLIEISGKAAQSAMTQIGTAGQKLTVYWG